MSKKLFFILLVGLFSGLSAEAQKDTLFYYIKTYGFGEKRVNSKDSADFYRMILSPDTNIANGLFIVQDYYKNGKPKMSGASSVADFRVKLQGPSIEYFPDGHRMAIKNFVDNKPIGDVTEYFPGGGIYLKGLYNDKKLIILECRDSTGKVLVENGNGHCVEYDQDFKYVYAEGDLVNSLEEGEWHGRRSDSVTYNITYNKGVIKKGVSYKNGKAYPFLKTEVEPEYPGGLDALYRHISANLHYPRVAKEMNIQGKVFVTFVIERDGSMVEIRVVRGLGGGCDEECIKVLKSSSKWTPGIQYGLPVRVAYTMPITFALQKN